MRIEECLIETGGSGTRGEAAMGRAFERRMRPNEGNWWTLGAFGIDDGDTRNRKVR